MSYVRLPCGHLRSEDDVRHAGGFVDCLFDGCGSSWRLLHRRGEGWVAEEMTA